MKLNTTTSLLIALLLTALNSKAQEYIEPQWKFYFAFEDATGARDTLWNVMDPLATSNSNGQQGWDTLFGEIPIELTPGVFNVYTYQGNLPNSFLFKTRARPIISSPDITIYANNFVLPIKVSWDTSLFRAPVLMQMIQGPINAPLLDNDYFFNYHGDWGAYSMLYDNEVEMPEFWWGYHFPLMCTMSRGWGNPLSALSLQPEKSTVVLHPNPVQDKLYIESTSSWKEALVIDAQGKVVLKAGFNAVQPALDVSQLVPGAYILRLHDEGGQLLSSARFIKLP